MRTHLASIKDFTVLRAMDALLGEDRIRRQWLRKSLKLGLVHVVSVQGRIVAYGAMAQNFFGRSFIEMLFVAEGERRRGYGTALMGHFEKAGLRSDAVWTSTNQSNRAMQRLLKRRGFVRCGKVSGLDPGDPELFYVKRKP